MLMRNKGADDKENRGHPSVGAVRLIGKPAVANLNARLGVRRH